ncbi:MAG: hypothetical protein FWG98_13685 [Candidatus Cloacimonetes bacterium]|nr:hypothetical protein [Candidatus Cloacimonadota bacterium]
MGDSGTEIASEGVSLKVPRNDGIGGSGTENINQITNYSLQITNILRTLFFVDFHRFFWEFDY